MEAIQIIKKAGGSLKDSYLDEGYVGHSFLTVAMASCSLYSFW